MASVADNDCGLNDLLYGLDELILEKVMAWGRRLYATILEQVDGRLKEQRDRTLSIVHRREVTIRTQLGPVRVRRRQYRGRDGSYRYLLDEALGMIRRSHITAGVIGKSLSLAVKMPFRQSAAVLEQVGRVILSHETIRRLVGRVGKAVVSRMEQEVEAFLATGALPESQGRSAALLMTEADGVAVPLQRQAVRKAEVKLGIAYEGWRTAGRGRYATINKTIFATTSPGAKYWAGMLLKLHRRYDLGQTDNVILGGDGAAWVRDGLTFLDGRFQLDRYHLFREMRAAFGADNESFYALRQCCEQGRLGEGLAILAKARKRSSDEESAERMVRLGRYLWDNRQGLRDYRLDLAGMSNPLRRTGAIEGNVDKLLAKRLKRQGMSWSPAGLSWMVAVRILYLEGQFGPRLKQLAATTLPQPLLKEEARRTITRTLRKDHGVWLKACMPVLSGPHADRPWVQWLKSLVKAPV